METENTALSLKDLIVAASGYNEELGFPNASCVLYMDILHKSGAAPTPVQEIPLLNPTVNIFRHAETSQITLTFPSKFDPELRAAYNALENFSKAENSADDNGNDFPMVRLVVIPNAFAGECYILAANPLLWTLSPADATGEPRVIRIAVADENLNAFYADKDEETETADESTVADAEPAAGPVSEATETPTDIT